MRTSADKPDSKQGNTLCPCPRCESTNLKLDEGDGFETEADYDQDIDEYTGYFVACKDCGFGMRTYHYFPGVSVTVKAAQLVWNKVYAMTRSVLSRQKLTGIEVEI